jgi:hypothetical protein
MFCTYGEKFINHCWHDELTNCKHTTLNVTKTVGVDGSIDTDDYMVVFLHAPFASLVV